MKAIATLGLLAATLALGACSETVQAPFDTGVCYYAVPQEGQAEPRYNVVARNQPQIEYCAARLEEMRLRFLRMGGNNRDIMGSYQGQFIFIDSTGVKVGKTLTGNRYFLLARTGDGRLAVPGAIQRDIVAEPATN